MRKVLMTWPGNAGAGRAASRTALVLAAATMVAGGCDDGRTGLGTGGDRAHEESSAATVDDLPEQWAWPADADEQVLHDAIDEARRTADAARERWRKADADERAHWAIKWRAPTEAGVEEFVWVRPVEWSAHRIEGVLANEPTRPLIGGPQPGEVVSFPAEEMVDWLYAPDGMGADSREGGWTIDALLDLRDSRP